MPEPRQLPNNSLIANLPSTTPFVGPETIERQRGRRFELRLGANESVFGPSPHALEAIRSAAPEIALYGDPENWELRAALSQREGVTPDQVIVGCGIDDLLGTLIRVLLNPGDPAVASLGAYPTVGFHMAGYGAHLERVPYLDFQNDLEALATTAQRIHARIVYVANPDNPTGTVHSGADISRLLASIPADCALLLDEAYTEFAPATTREITPVGDPRLIRLRTFSKAYGMAGARIGYAIGSVALAREVEKVRLHFGVTRLSQIAALAALGDQPYLEQVVADVAQGRDEYSTLARDLGLTPLPSATNFVAFDMGSTERAQALGAALTQRDVFIRTPGVGPTQLIRITVGTAQQRERFAQLFREALAVVDAREHDHSVRS